MCMLGAMDLFDEGAAKVYAKLSKMLAGLGDVVIEEKTKSLHVKAGSGSAFAGVHPRKGALLLNIRLDRKLLSKRMKKTEKVSKSRWHNELLLAAPGDVDDELVSWLRAAYALAKT